MKTALAIIALGLLTVAVVPAVPTPAPVVVVAPAAVVPVATPQMVVTDSGDQTESLGNYARRVTAKQ
jgi:hypothetical protein